MEDRCVICGEIIPEGSWVCPKCVKAHTVTCEDCGKIIYTRSYATKRCKACSKERERIMTRLRKRRHDRR